MKEQIGIIAGEGAFPIDFLAQLSPKYLPFVLKINGLADLSLDKYDGKWVGIGEFGKMFKALKASNVKRIAFIGYVKRPDISKVSFDGRGLLMLPSILSAAKKGDDALMRIILSEFEKEGFEIVGPEEFESKIIAPIGQITELLPSSNDFQDIEKAWEIAKSIGRFDIGQGCVVADGVVLALEAQEGTDEMLKRVAKLPSHFIGSSMARKGVLLKCAKPIQDKRIDLPTIGLSTLENANAAGLSGIAIEAGAALLAHKDQLIAKANEYSMFIYGYKGNDHND